MLEGTKEQSLPDDGAGTKSPELVNVSSKDVLSSDNARYGIHIDTIISTVSRNKMCVESLIVNLVS